MQMCSLVNLVTQLLNQMRKIVKVPHNTIIKSCSITIKLMLLLSTAVDKTIIGEIIIIIMIHSIIFNLTL